MRAAVVGCGTAGPAAALHLARRLGARVDLFDRTAEPAAVGAGIGVQPIGLTALKNLGLLEPVLAHGARIDGIRTWVHNDRATEGVWAGRRVLDIEYARYDPRLFGVGLHRGVLFEALFEACQAEADVTLRLGEGVASLEQEQDTVRLRGSTGTQHGPYHIVVVADGQRSRLREQLGLRSWFRRYRYGALFALLPDEEHLFGNTLQQVHAGPGTATTLGFLPTGVPWGHGIDTVGDHIVDTATESVATLYYNLHEDAYAGWEEDGLDRWKDRCCELMPHAADLIQDGLAHKEQVAFARYADGAMLRFNKGRVVVIGDAGHCMSPQLGQGANLALIDAEKLVDCLADAGGEASAVEGALAEHTKRRWWRLQFYQAQSRVLTPVFASQSNVLRHVRNALLYPGCHTPVLRHFMHVSSDRERQTRTGLPTQRVWGRRCCAGPTAPTCSTPTPRSLRKSSWASWTGCPRSAPAFPRLCSRRDTRRSLRRRSASGGGRPRAERKLAAGARCCLHVWMYKAACSFAQHKAAELVVF